MKLKTQITKQKTYEDYRAAAWMLDGKAGRQLFIDFSMGQVLDIRLVSKARQVEMHHISPSEYAGRTSIKETKKTQTIEMVLWQRTSREREMTAVVHLFQFWKHSRSRPRLHCSGLHSSSSLKDRTGCKYLVWTYPWQIFMPE